MLKITPHKSASASQLYEYYSEQYQTIGHWGGFAADRLGQRGEVSPEAFIALCDNIHPAMGDRLTARTKEERRKGYDFNFNPPKSVSLMHAYTGDERIVRAVERAADEVMALIEQDVQTRVRIGGQNTDRLTGNIAWARFTHRFARPVDGVADPQIHLHLFVFNATFDPQERRWKAVQLGDIKVDGPYYQMLFHSRTAQLLREIGYEIIEKGKSYEMAGIPEAFIQQNSRRRQQIDGYAEARGIRSHLGRDKLGVVTRERKNGGQPSADEAREAWLSRLTPMERALREQVSQRRSPLSPVSYDARLEDRAIEYAKQYCLEQNSVVDVRTFVEGAMRVGMSRLDPRRLYERVVSESSLVHREHNGRLFVTTPKVVAEEKAMVAWVQRGRGSVTPIAPNHLFSPSLSEEQQHAAHSVLNSRDRATAVVGRAGTGKTRLMNETIGAIRATGMSVTVLAPYGNTARGTLRNAGFPEANTVDTFLVSAKMQDLARGGVLWIDEAGLLGSQDLLKLMAMADHLNARIVLSGDTRQHRAVKRGDAFRLLLEHAELERATLTVNRRQRGALRAVVDLVAEHRVIEALERLDASGGIIEMEGPERHELIAHRYVELLEQSDTAIIISPTHSEGRKVTAHVRAALKTAGGLQNERTFIQLQRVDLRKADQMHATTYQPGWIVEMVQSAPGHDRGNRYPVSLVTEPDVYVLHPDGSTRHFDVAKWTDKFQVYEPASIRLAVGDEIRITAGGYDTSHRKLENGTNHRITAFTEGGDIRLENGQVLSDDFAHITYGYVSTSYAAQSRTVNHVLIAEGFESFPAGSLEQIYVSLSRAQFSGTIFTTCKADLFDAVRRSSQRLATLDLADTHISNPHARIDLGALDELLKAQELRVLLNRQLIEYDPLLPGTRGLLGL